QLAALTDLPGISLYSLQKGPAAAELRGTAAVTPMIDCGSEMHDFADCAALISELDLIVSVDTAPAHVAGALGKPVWILLPFAPDRRWLLEREDSPWYPSARLFRQQEAGDWAEVLERVVAALRALIDAGPSKRAGSASTQHAVQSAITLHRQGHIE